MLWSRFMIAQIQRKSLRSDVTGEASRWWPGSSCLPEARQAARGRDWPASAAGRWTQPVLPLLTDTLAGRNSTPRGDERLLLKTNYQSE